MSQEGAILPQDVEGSSPGGTGSAGSGSVSSSATENISAGSKPASPVSNPPEDVEGTHDGSNSSSGSVKLAGEVLNRGSKPASPLVVHAGENSNGGSKPASPAAVLGADESNKGEEKDELVGGEGGGDDAAGDSGGVTGSNSKLTKSSLDGDAQDDVKDAPKPMATAGGGGGGGGKGKGKGAAAEADHAMHIWTERERRKKMKNMYSTLHSLLPRLPDKVRADKATIVGEAVDYIKTLQGTVQRLEKLKMERMRAQLQLGAGSSSSVASAPPPMLHGTLPAPATRETILANMVHNWSVQHRAARGSVALPLGPFQSWSASNMALSVAGNEALVWVCTPRQPCVLTKVLCVLEKYRIDVVTMNISSHHNQCLISIHARINPASACKLMTMTAEDRYKLAVSEILQWLAK